MAGRRHSADRHRHGDRARVGRHQFVAHAGQQPLGGDRHIVRRAVLEDDAEFVARIAAQRIAPAHQAADALAHHPDHLIGGIVAVRLVDAAEIVDGDQEKAAGGPKAHRFLECLLQNFGQVIAVEFARELVAAGEVLEPALALVALVDDMDGAVGARGLAVGPGEPAPRILDPEPRLLAGIGRMAYWMRYGTPWPSSR